MFPTKLTTSILATVLLLGAVGLNTSAQLGVNLGAGTGFRGQGVVLPVASVVFGLRF